jgi:signal transduction histidine kinase
MRAVSWADLAGGLVTRPVARRRGGIARRFAVVHRGVGFWMLSWALVAGAQAAILVPVIDGGEPVPGTDVVYRLMGGSFAACGLVAWRRRPDSPSGPLMVATGCAFFATPLLRLGDAPAAQTIAQLLSETWVIPYAALVLSFLSGRLSRLDRVLVASFAIPVVILQIVGLSFLDVPGNVMLLFPGQIEVAEAIDPAQRVTAALSCATTALVVSLRWRAASAPRRRALLPSLAGAVCLMLFALLLVTDLLPGPRSQALIWVANCSLVAVPAAFLAGLLRSRLARGGLAELLLALRTMRGAELQAALARAIGDPGLAVAYAAPAGGGYVDARGAPVALPARGGERSVAPVPQRGGGPALLVYDAALDDDPALVEAVAAATGMALEHERLEDDARMRLAELEASRERIVAAGDAERRRLERDLHDGAQQRLVALGMQLRIIRDRLGDDPADVERLVAAAGAELASSLEELRELARGIHPAVLDHGLAAALESLASRAAVPARVRFDAPAVVPRPVELAVYFVVSESLANVGKHAGATAVEIRVSHANGTLAVEVADDGPGGADPAAGSGLRGLQDRVHALHGRLEVFSPPGRGTVVRTELPCAS